MKQAYCSRIVRLSVLLLVSVSLPSISVQRVESQETLTGFPSSSFLSERFASLELTGKYDESERRKSPTRAALYSLLLPGMGELYAGNFSTGRYLLGSEVTLWLTLVGVQSYGRWLRDDARSFAEVNAGVDWSNKDDKFFVNIGNFNSRREYNEKKMRDRDIGSLYLDESYEWEWQSDEARQKYREMRVRSDQMFNAIRFVGAAIIANHIISAIIAGNSAARYNERIDSGTHSSRWSLGILPLHNGFVAGLQHTF